MNGNVALLLRDELDTELRLNDELKKKNLIDEFIQELPEYVNEWYLNLMAGDRSCLCVHLINSRQNFTF